MAKAIRKKVTPKRPEKYEPKVSFNGTFEDMIEISKTGAGVRKTADKSKLNGK